MAHEPSWEYNRIRYTAPDFVVHSVFPAGHMLSNMVEFILLMCAFSCGVEGIWRPLRPLLAIWKPQTTAYLEASPAKTYVFLLPLLVALSGSVEKDSS